MQRIAHSFYTLVLALALALTGPGISGPAKGAMLIELCAEDAPREIWVDAEGNPVKPDRSHAKCLDCILFSAPLPDVASGRFTLAPLRVVPVPFGPTAEQPHPIAHLRPVPRGPPPALPLAMRPGDLRPLIRSLHLSALAPLDPHQVAHAPVTDPRAIL